MTLHLKNHKEIKSRNSSNLNNLQIFSCVACTHIRQGKLDVFLVKCMLLCYPKGVKGYCLWCFKTGFKKCIINQDIIFNEIEMSHKPGVLECESRCSCDGVNLNIKVEFGIEKAHDFLQNEDLNDLVKDRKGVSDGDSWVDDYKIDTDRARRTIEALERYRYVELIM